MPFHFVTYSFQIKHIKLFLLLCFYNNCILLGQFNSATIHINGLTCSACSFAVQRSISTIDFVERIDMDLNENIAMIVFKKNKAHWCKRRIGSKTGERNCESRCSSGL